MYMKNRNSITLKYKIIVLRTCLFLALFICNNLLFAQEAIVISKSKLPLSIGKKVAILNDKEGLYDSSNIVLQQHFIMSDKPVPVFSSPKNNIWIKFTIKNISNSSDLHVTINYSDISKIWLYENDSLNKLHLLERSGNTIDFYKREGNGVGYNLNLNLTSNAEK